jgi:group I intron endonuclease
MRNRHKLSGVYKIENVRNGKFYIGSTSHFYRRKRQHLHLLRSNSHPARALQEDFNSFGEEFFDFVLVFPMPGASKDELLDKEQEYLDKRLPDYNLSPSSRYGKFDATEEYRKKKSDDMKRWWKEGKFDSRKGINYFVKNGKPVSLGTHLSDERKKHLSEINMGEKNPNFGKHRTPESKQKTSRSNGRIYYDILSPDGELFEQIRNMTEFCKERGLGISEMVAVAKGRRRHHRGWTCENPGKNQQVKTAKMLGIV